MKRGGKILCSVAMAAVTACAAQPELQIRPTALSPSMTAKPVPIRIAEARAQFALGNVALALETFRKAAREDPSSIDALTGIAACYDRMGRFDLSRRNYEAALALAPGDTQLLGALAVSLQQQGAHEEAAAVRQEIALRRSANAAPAAPTVEPAIQLAAAAPVEPVVAAPAPQPVEVVQPAPVQEEIAAVASAPAEPIVPELQPAPEPAPPVQVADAEAVAPPVQLKPLAEPEVGTSVTIDLPPPRPAEPVMQAEAQPAPEPAPVPAPEAPLRTAEAIMPERPGPRLERLSMGVVALVTGDGPHWEAKTVAQSDRSTTVRFVPLREANAAPVKVRVLNAARVDRLAARTRSWLTNRGWAEMAIGDAPAPRAESLVVYPAGQRALAQTLANQFGFAMEERADARFVTMLLGRDAARIEELRPRRA